MRRVLTLNAGSSSLKFGLFEVAEAGGAPRAVTAGNVERIGGAARLLPKGGEPREVAAADHAEALAAALEWLEAAEGAEGIAAVGHRIVHGGTDFAAPAVLDAGALGVLAGLERLAPLHQPANLAGVRAARAAFPDAVQVGCFDTAFHRGMPEAAAAYALPEDLRAAGVRRYGFHGLSYDFIAGELARRDPALAAGRVVVAHLGAGASMCGMVGGASRATSMGFSALEGLVMGTRCGSLDPGVMLHLVQEGWDAGRLEDLLYRRSGLLGLSGIGGDMRTLEASGAPEAAFAIAVFAHRARREIGALAAEIGGLDGLVFTAGIGENSARARAEICAGLEWLGVALDAGANAAGAEEIGAAGARVRVMVLATDEEAVIARAAAAALG